MGGKTAMRFAQMFEEKVLSLIVADMGIKEYSPQHDHILEALNAIDPPHLKSRSEAEESLRRDIQVEGVVQFLLKNLYRRKEGGYAWRFNLPVLEAAMSDILEELPSVSVDIPTLFIRGSESNYVGDEDWPEIKELFPQAQLKTIENAGHWLHADQPEEFYQLVRNFLLKKS
jgi:pimeloyl-ACP methyl ester carboxylesterase